MGENKNIKAAGIPAADERTGLFDDAAIPGADAGDTFSIYQLKQTDETTPYRWMSSSELESAGLSVKRDNYDHIYTAPLPKGMDLDGIYMKFNTDIPDGFTGHSLSVSDIVVLKKNGVLSAHYVDNTGFADVPGFLGRDCIRNAEPGTEQNYGMGGGVINNQSADAKDKEHGTGSPMCAMKGITGCRVSGGKPSVMDRLNAEKKEMRPSVKTGGPKEKTPEIERGQL